MAGGDTTDSDTLEENDIIVLTNVNTSKSEDKEEKGVDDTHGTEPGSDDDNDTSAEGGVDNPAQDDDEAEEDEEEVKPEVR